MKELAELLALFVAAVILAGAARRVGAPYPVFLAIGGALLAFFPGAPSFSVPPELVLALFVAPVLLDAAYDTSPRDLKDNWVPRDSVGRVRGRIHDGGGRPRRSRPGARNAVGGGDCARRACRSTRRGSGDCRAPPVAAAAANPDHPRRGKPAQRCQRPADLPRRRWRRGVADGFSPATVAPTFFLAVGGQPGRQARRSAWLTCAYSNACSTCRPPSFFSSSLHSACGCSPNSIGLSGVLHDRMLRHDSGADCPQR